MNLTALLKRARPIPCLLLATTALIPIAGASTTFTPTLQDAFRIGGVVEGNFSAGNSESEGALIIGGNMTSGQNGYRVQLRAGAELLNGHALYVGGQIALQGNNPNTLSVSGSVQYGSLRDGIPDGWINTTVGSAPAGSTASQGATDVTQVFSDLRAMNSRIATLASTSGVTTVSIPQNESNFVLTKPATGPIFDSSILDQPFYIFNVNASEFTNKTLNNTNLGNQGWSSTDLIILNIINDLAADQIINFGFDISGEWADNILWNVATGNISNQNKQITGSLLAPNSIFHHGNSNMVGSFFVKEYVGGNAELHPVTFNGTPGGGGSPIPEPSSALVGLLVAAGLLRRNRAA